MRYVSHANFVRSAFACRMALRQVENFISEMCGLADVMAWQLNSFRWTLCVCWKNISFNLFISAVFALENLPTFLLPAKIRIHPRVYSDSDYCYQNQAIRSTACIPKQCHFRYHRFIHSGELECTQTQSIFCRMHRVITPFFASLKYWIDDKRCDANYSTDGNNFRSGRKHICAYEHIQYFLRSTQTQIISC